MRKIRKLVMDKKGMSYPLTVALVLALLIALCVLAEFFRLSIIAYGVRNALQESVISVATTNYNEVYDGLREGYSGGMPCRRVVFLSDKDWNTERAGKGACEADHRADGSDCS